MNTTLTIDVLSDVVCPWCLIGKRRLEQALAMYAERHPDRPAPLVRWHPFQLNPDMPETGMSRADYVRRKFGDRADTVYDRVKAVGRSLDIPFQIDAIARQPNTAAAHSLIGLAEVGEQQQRLVESLFCAYFLEGVDLTRPDELARLAIDAGLSADAVQFVALGAGTANVMEAMRAGTVDALCHVDPVLHYLEQKNELRLMADTRTLSSSQRMFGGPLASACLFGKVEFLQRHADLAQSLSLGVVRALKWLKTAGPTDILRTVPSHHWMGDRALYLGALEKLRESYSLDGLFGKDAVQTAWRMRALRLAQAPGSMSALERSFTNQFAQVAKRKIGN